MFVRIPRETLRSFAEGCYVDSPIYHTGSWPVRELQWRKLGALIRMAKDETGRALDLCCGNGVLLPTLSRMFDSVAGLDIHTTAAECIVQLFELENVALVADNAYDMPFDDNSFDCVFAASCLEHFESVDNIAREISRVLKPSGRLYVLTPTENLLYCIGRKLLRYTKPVDHYWTARRVEDELSYHYLKPIKLRSYPAAMLPIYRMGVYQNNG